MDEATKLEKVPLANVDTLAEEVKITEEIKAAIEVRTAI